MKIKFKGSKDFYPTISGENMSPQFIPESSCESIVANNHIEFLHIKEVGGFMKFLSSRLAPGGKVYMAGSDCVEISRLMYTNDINIITFNELMFSDRTSAWCLVTLKNMFEQVGIVPITAMLGGIGNCEYYLTGVKS